MYDSLDRTERRSLGIAGRRRGLPVNYRRRRTAALLLLAAALAVFYVTGQWSLSRATAPDNSAGAGAGPGGQTAAVPTLTFSVETYLPAGDLNGDGQPEQVAISPAVSHKRQIALVTGTGQNEKLIGQPTTVPDFPLKLADLPRAKNVLVLLGTLPVSGEPKAVTVAGEKAFLTTGGEPRNSAWRLDASTGLVSADYYPLAAPTSPPAQSALVVDKYLNVLWHYDKGQLAGTYRISTGVHLAGPRPTAANQKGNYLTPTGRFTIANKSPGMPYYKEQLPALDPRNPLGTRWMGFSVYSGDGGLVWGIHGTREPEKIGQWTSDGCIRLSNPDVEKLYERVQAGTVLEIIDSRLKPLL